MTFRLLLLLISISTLSGCTLIYSFSDNLPQRINTWIENNEYRTALETINYVKPDHKDYRTIQKQKKLIQKKIVPYENNALQQSSLLMKKGEWLKALALLEETEDNLVDKSRIRKQRESLLQKREVVIAAYRNDILNVQAKELLGKMELYKKIKKTVTASEGKELDIKEFDEIRHETCNKLKLRSEVLYENSYYGKAMTSINLALKLEPEEDLKYDLVDLKKKINQKTRVKKASYVKDIKELLSKLSQGYSHSILKEAKEKIEWLIKIKNDDREYTKLLGALQKLFNAGLKQHFEAARKLYSQGKTQEALSIWLDMKELDPEYPKLQSHIERAEKILEKLKKLSNQP